MLKSFIVKSAGVVRKAAEAVIAKIGDGVRVVRFFAALRRARRRGLAPVLLAGALVALTAGCASRVQDALLILAPEEGGDSVHAVVKVPYHMEKGSSDIAINIDGDDYAGKMICAKEGFTSSSSAVAINSGGGYSFGGGGGQTTANLSACKALLISGKKTITCELSGTFEEVTSQGKQVAQGLLFVPTLGWSSIFLEDDYAPLGTGKCKSSEGVVYAVQVAEPPEK